MNIEFQNVRVQFPETQGGRARETASAKFSGEIDTVGAALNGFNMNFGDSDREVSLAEVNVEDTNLEFSGDLATVPVTLWLRPGNVNRPFSGYVDVTFIGVVRN